MRIAFALIALFAAVALASAVPRRANAAACDATASPRNAQARIDAAGAGQTVCLEASVFRGPLVIYGKNDVTLRGAGKFNTIVSGGSADAIVILNSSGVTVEDMTLYQGSPANVYIGRSSNITLRRLDIGGGNIGVHFDDGSAGTLAESFVYALRRDGVLIRRGSGAAIERNWIFYNAGLGVSIIGNTGYTSITRNIISDHGGPGVFAGMPPCAGLPGASLAVPACFLQNPAAYVASAQLVLDGNVIQASGSTGIVLFPGVSATMTGNRVWRNHMTGLFAWGADVTSRGEDYDGNDEHAIEIRAYPDPRGPVHRGASARFDGMMIRNTAVWPDTGTLGGGLIAHGAYVELTNSSVHFNAGIGVSYQTGSTGRVVGNKVSDNRGAGICFYGAGAVYAAANDVWNNATNVVGGC